MRRRKGEAGGSFQSFARRIVSRFNVRHSFRSRARITSRYIAIPPEACAVAHSYLADSLDMLGMATGDDANGITFDDSIDPVQISASSLEL